MSSVPEFGLVIREAHQRSGLSWRELAEASHCSVSHLQRLEGGHVSRPSPEVLRRLSDCLPVSYERLMQAAGYLDDVWPDR